MGSDTEINSAGQGKTYRRFVSPGFLLTAEIAVAIAGGLMAATAGCRRVPQLTPQEREGKHLYSVRCAHCHEDNDLGLKKAPPDLHRVFAEAKLPSGLPASDLNVRAVVLAGKGMMPSFAGRFTDEQMSALLAYLHTGLR